MTSTFKRIGLILLTVIMSVILMAGAYAAVKSPDNEPKVKNAKQEMGKNWEIKDKQMTSKKVPANFSNHLKAPTPEEITKAKENRDKRPHPAKIDGPRPN